MKPERWLLLCLIFGLLLAGLGTLRGEVAALALPFLAYLGLAYAQAPAPLDEAQLSAARSLDHPRVRPGQPVAMRIELSNPGADLAELAVRAPLPAGTAQTGGALEARLALPAGETLILDSTIQGRRGEFDFGPLLLETCETFGLFAVQSELPAPGRLIVEPAAENLRPFILRPPQTRGFAGPVPARQGGRGTDFFTVREYQPGDPLRQVNWKLSSRSERSFYTNIYEQQRIADVGIILDARVQVDLRSARGSLFEYSVKAAASLVSPILRAGNRLGLLVYGPGMESIFPGYGKVQQRRILRALARAGAGHNYALESLAHLPVRFFPAGSQIILISPLAPEDPPLVAHLVALGYAVLVISPDPLAFDAPDVSPSDLAWRIAAAERRAQLQRLRRSGVAVVDWNINQPLAPLLQQALRRR